MRLIVAGTPEVALPALTALADSAHDVVAVITRPDALAGRGRRLHRSPVAEWAVARGLPILQPRTPRDPAFLAELAALAPDCVPVIAYGALIPKVALDLPRFGWINLHFSLLPAWRGAAPVQHAIMAGDEVTGASTFLIEEGLDTGPVYGVLTEPIRPADTAGELLGRLAAAGAGLLVATLDGIERGELVAVPQPAEGVCLAPKVTVEQAQVDWAAPATVIDRLVRSVTPAPGAWTVFRGERLGLGPVRVADAVPASGPGAGTGAAGTGAGTGAELALARGEIRATKRAVFVGTSAGAVELGQVRPVGRKEMPAPDWARGIRPQPGETFEPVGTAPAGSVESSQPVIS